MRCAAFHSVSALRRPVEAPVRPGPVAPVPPMPTETVIPSAIPHSSLWQVAQATVLSEERIGS